MYPAEYNKKFKTFNLIRTIRNKGVHLVQGAVMHAKGS
jgi:hypothetical protein